jgi:hypothetical protein
MKNHGPDFMQKMNSKRGKVISNFSYLENIISTFISAAYFTLSQGDQMNAMKEEILEDKLFGFEFKRQLLEKILKKRFPDVYKTLPRQKIERMQTIRNIIAHGVLTATGEIDKPDSITDISFRHGGKNFGAEKMFEEYEEKRATVQPVLEKLPGLTTQIVA